MLAARRRNGRSYEPEVAPAIVGADEPEPVAVIDGILVLVFACAMTAKLPAGWSAGNTLASLVMWLAASTTINLPSRVRPAPMLNRSSSSDRSTCRGVWRAESVTPKLELPLLLFILHGVEQCAIVSGPDDRSNALASPGSVSPVARSLIRKVYCRNPFVFGWCKASQRPVVG